MFCCSLTVSEDEDSENLGDSSQLGSQERFHPVDVGQRGDFGYGSMCEKSP